MRSAVERFFGWIKSFRRIIIRYERQHQHTTLY
jgi:transposase